MKVTRDGRSWRLLLATLLALSVVAAACGGSDDNGGAAGDGGTGSDSASGGGGGEDAFLEETKERLERWYEGTDRDLPTSAPKPQPGKNIWIISCGQVALGCSTPANGAKEAGELIGWKMTIFDGKLNPALYSDGVRQAIAAKADGIVLDVVDCVLVKGALEEAKKAGIKIFANYSLDCNDPAIKGQPLFDAEVTYGPEYANYRELVLGYGETMADWIIAKTEGKAQTVQFRQDELLVVKYINDGFEKRFKQCKTCKLLETVNFTLADLGPPLQQKAQGALLKNPTANSVMVPYDSAVTLGIAAAVVGSGRNDQLFVSGGEGFAPNVELIHDNKGQDSYTGAPSRWTGWAVIDGMNRLLQGQPQVDSGIGWQRADKDRNLPPKGKFYDGTKDYETNYRKIWGVSK